MAIVIALLAFWVMVGLTVRNRPEETDLGDCESQKTKLREHLVLDIRGANRYCLGYIALFGVIATVGADHADTFRLLFEELDVWPFEIAFAAAILSTLFIPVGYGKSSFSKIRGIWFRTILCEQLVVLFTCYGIWSAYVVLIA